ncbi:MAG: hypothetical protein GXY51_10805 [Bacteroidetes bacterium]|nr:hypothetical protein [Bacteroidota bacterium]
MYIEVPEDMSAGNTHDYFNMIERKLTQSYDNLTVTIHVEPL